MMCARVLLLTGHTEEARQVIEFWANPQVPRKTKGEWYARYDAHARAVDAGSGARFDEPEWDANGYFIYLLNEYHRAKGVWLVDPKKQFYELADFLVSHMSSNGLLQEGGIVEWTGYLPATNMICAAALETAAKMAQEFGNPQKSAAYAEASKRIAAALPQMFDKSRQTYADVRSTDRKGGTRGESDRPIGREDLFVGHHGQCGGDLGIPKPPCAGVIKRVLCQAYGEAGRWNAVFRFSRRRFGRLRSRHVFLHHRRRGPVRIALWGQLEGEGFY